MAIDGKITNQLLKTKSGEFDIESIHTLVLSNLDISDLGCVGECSVLERLDLSRNDVSKLLALSGLISLTHLNLSANRITSLEGLQSLDNLQMLNVAGNLIGSVDTLRTVASLEKLRNLRLQDTVHELTNPLCMNLNYKSDVTELFPRLKELDGQRLVGPGSELFKMFADMDSILEGMPDGGQLTELPVPQPWVKSDYWQHTDAFEQTSLADSEQQFDVLLEECHKLKEEAASKLKTLHGHKGDDCVTPTMKSESTTNVDFEGDKVLRAFPIDEQVLSNSDT